MEDSFKGIDWSKFVVTEDMIDYVLAKYGNKWYVDEAIADVIMDDLQRTFNKPKLVKVLMVVPNTPNGLKMATNKDYRKLLVTDEMLEYIFAKYGNKWHLEDDIAYVILKDLLIKYGKDDKGKGKVHDLDLKNRIEKLEVDFGRMIKAKEAKQADHDQLKVNTEVIEISSDEGVFGDEDLVLFTDLKYPLTDAEIMMFKERPKDPKLPQDKLLLLLLPMHKLL
ncbi:hypothetical protein Tco_0000661 [Tanacetum coccineum]